MLVGEWDFEREKEVARQEVAQHYEALLQTEKTVSAQYKSQIQALREENRKLRAGR